MGEITPPRCRHVCVCVQVLEERTHPAMLMEGQSGYILSAVVVQKNSSQH